MKRLLAFAALACALLASGAAAQSDAREERFVIVSNGENVGHLRATTRDASIEIDYVVDNNGRGPRLRHHITLGTDGLPSEWRIEGRSLFGASVDERFSQNEARASWTSQADEGAANAAMRKLYVANDDTPFSLSLYARALLHAPNRTRDVLPGGALRLEEVRRARLGEGARAIDVTIERLTGLGLSPSTFMLDGDNRLVAEVSGGQIAVREGYEDEERTLRRLAEELEAERYRTLQQQLAHRFDAPVRVRNVRVFDPETGRLGAPGAVTFFQDAIVALEPGAANAPTVGAYDIDAEGGVLVPGLHDMHAHVNPQAALLYLAAGITTVRDQGNDNERLMRMSEDFENGALAGPRIVRNGFIEGRSPYSARLGFVADSLEEALDAVRWYAAHGYWQIKIYNSVHPDWVRPIVHEAHRVGMTVSGHVPAFVTPDEAIEAGYSDIAHINQLMLGWLLAPGEDTRTELRLTAMARAADLDLRSRRVRRTIDLMRRNHVALDTTLVTLETLMLSRARQVPSSHAHNIEHMPIGYQRYRKRSFAPIASPEEGTRYARAFERIQQTLLLLHRAGVQLLPGTDDGTGFTAQRELELYAAAGIPASEVLALATLRAERYLGRDQRLGSIARGKLADFILIPRDPTQDISAIREVRMTVRGGVVYFPSEVYPAFGILPFAAPPTIRPPTQ